MKLSIIIPQYKETQEQMYNLLSILNNQQGVDKCDFEVLIVNDHSNTRLSTDYISMFTNVHINLLSTKKNVGSGLCRQYGADNSSGEWIMFVDADDLLYSYLTVKHIIDLIDKASDKDCIFGKFYEERHFYDTVNYNLSNGNTWLHGKVYKRAFLKKHKIKFPKGLRIDEDSYFNRCVCNISSNIMQVDEPFVIWRYNKNSITRADANFYYTANIELVKALDLFCEYMRKHEPLKSPIHICMCLIQLYMIMQEKKWQNAPLSEKNKFKKAIYNFYSKYWLAIYQVSENCFNRLYNGYRAEQTDVNFREKETFIDFYGNLVKELENKEN